MLMEHGAGVYSKKEALQVQRDARKISFGLFPPSTGGKRSNHSYRDSELHSSPFLVSYRVVPSNKGIQLLIEYATPIKITDPTSVDDGWRCPIRAGDTGTCGEPSQ